MWIPDTIDSMCTGESFFLHIYATGVNIAVSIHIYTGSQHHSWQYNFCAFFLCNDKWKHHTHRMHVHKTNTILWMEVQFSEKKIIYGLFVFFFCFDSFRFYLIFFSFECQQTDFVVGCANCDKPTNINNIRIFFFVQFDLLFFSCSFQPILINQLNVLRDNFGRCLANKQINGKSRACQMI